MANHSPQGTDVADAKFLDFVGNSAAAAADAAAGKPQHPCSSHNSDA